nr:HD domain-containing phosphohydrolase [uncultured Sulfurimonas sp.]
MLENFTVLAVDDEPYNLDIIEAAFMDYTNIEITNATDAKEALEYLEEKKFNVVLLDIRMPEMDGLEALKIIKQNPKLKQLPILMVTANAEKEAEALKLGASDFIAKPYDIEVLVARTINYAKLNRYHEQITNQAAILEEQVRLRTIELQEALALSKETEYEISIRLGRASEFRDLETGGHIKRMSLYSQILARLYGLDEEECELVLYAAPLHDIGKVGIPDSILLKPGRFEPHEFEIMKQHSIIGAKMLDGAQRFPVINAGRIIALQHHEKWDGTGYPNALKAEEIHLYARIITIADVFDALSSKRCYKEPMKLDKVLNIMTKDAGTHFDPHLIELFLNNLDEFLEIKDKYQDEEEPCEIESFEERR